MRGGGEEETHRRRGDEVLQLDGAAKESSGDGHVRDSKASWSGSLGDLGILLAEMISSSLSSYTPWLTWTLSVLYAM